MNFPWIKDNDHTISNVLLCAVLVLIEAAQLLIVVVLIFSFVPIPGSSVVLTLFPRLQQLVMPEREMWFYRLFVGLVLVGQAGALAVFRRELRRPELWKRLRPFLLAEAGWLFLMLFAVFKIFVYGFTAWTHFLYVVIAGALLSKIFWKEISAAGGTIAAMRRSLSPRGMARWTDFLFPLVIVALVFIPDVEAVVARIYMGDCLHHIDSTLMGQAWVYANGGSLNVDIYAHYGIGMPIFITWAMKLLGGLSYENLIRVLMGGTIIYFILVYFFLRRWLGNAWLAMAGTLIAIKWQMFHPGVYPLVFTYPYSTVLRYGFDMVMFGLLLAHVRRGNIFYLVGAAVVGGLALFHISDTGVYLVLALIFYLLWRAICGNIGEGRKAWIEAGVCLALIPVSAVAWFWVFQGPSGFSREFWARMTERIDLFLIGHGNLPMYKSLVDGAYASSFMGLVIPALYCFVLVTTGSLSVLRKAGAGHIIAAVLCVYGLGLYHYYVCRSVETNYYTVCVPFVLILCYACHAGIKDWAASTRRMAGGYLLGGAVFALLTSHAFLSYPNMINFSRHPIVAPAVKVVVKDLDHYFTHISRRVPADWKFPLNSLGESSEDLSIETDFKTDASLKAYFKQAIDFHDDAGLIAGLTSGRDKVALLSSFETAILMQAGRRPYFYYFPLIDSRPMRMRSFPLTSLWTTGRLALTIRQMEQSPPPYVFIEKILLNRQVPRIYNFLAPELLAILAYLDGHYRPAQSGKYLVALKRIQE